ncbi:helix-loop-helix domain-containing protein [Endozoicomonas sp.]|uniref:helix-loop-helix domain-containing protein n=1 Tax=Endozoicomonas sp. TaxID=1892382 RepID=UPI00383B8DAE
MDIGLGPYPQQSCFNPQEETKRSFDAGTKRGAHFHRYDVNHLEQCSTLTTEKKRYRYLPKKSNEEQRQSATSRKKNRMDAIRDGFELLKNKLPENRRLSKIEILNHAISRINSLTEELNTTSNISGRSVSGNNSIETLTD